MKTETKIEFYKESKEDFNKFLAQCKRAMNKINGFNVPTDNEEWSLENTKGQTFWNQLKETGQLSYSEGSTSEGYVKGFDFDFGNHVYAYYEEKGV